MQNLNMNNPVADELAVPVSLAGGNNNFGSNRRRNTTQRSAGLMQVIDKQRGIIEITGATINFNNSQLLSYADKKAKDAVTPAPTSRGGLLSRFRQATQQPVVENRAIQQKDFNVLLTDVDKKEGDPFYERWETIEPSPEQMKALLDLCTSGPVPVSTLLISGKFARVGTHPTRTDSKNLDADGKPRACARFVPIEGLKAEPVYHGMED